MASARLLWSYLSATASQAVGLQSGRYSRLGTEHVHRLKAASMQDKDTVTEPQE